MSRRFMAGEDVSYGAPQLRRSGKTIARLRFAQCRRPARVRPQVESEKNVDGICSGDLRFGGAKARAYVEAVLQLPNGLLGGLQARMCRDLFGECG